MSDEDRAARESVWALARKIEQHVENDNRGEVVAACMLLIAALVYERVPYPAARAEEAAKLAQTLVGLIMAASQPTVQ